MRIDGFQNIPALLQSFKVDKSLKSNPESETNGSSASVSLSSFAEVLQTLQRESAQSGRLRSTRVDQLAKDAQSGDLSVDVVMLATNLVDLQVIDSKGQA